ncbi:tRNA1(Val) (adenine(37)-N6)-methyltransferase [Spirosoma pomorum]
MFRFKQFTIQQDRTAMKVCTDACVLGAWSGLADIPNVRILDIGTGTGLLALMAAQRNATALIDAVEIDPVAAGQATENVAASPFADRVTVSNARIQDFEPAQRYDHILTNPPFYTNHLRSPNAAVNRALHTDELSFSDLLTAVNRLLKPGGQWWVLLPPYEAGQLAKLARSYNLLPVRRLALQHHEQKPVFRILTGFAYKQNTCQDETLAVYELDGRTYTNAFQHLLRDFYLIF